MITVFVASWVCCVFVDVEAAAPSVAAGASTSSGGLYCEGGGSKLIPSVGTSVIPKMAHPKQQSMRDA